MTTFVVLLRGVNVTGNNVVPMAQLKVACEKAGFANVRTYINSGNVVLEGAASAAAVEAKVEALLAKAFKVHVPVIVRTAQEWAAYAKTKPFPKAEDKFLHLGLTKSPPNGDLADAIHARATKGEQAKLVGDAVWIDYANGVGASKVTPAFLDKAAGSPLTARNWNTVRKLAELARRSDESPKTKSL